MSGGLTPAKKSSEIASPTQITNPNSAQKIYGGQSADALFPQFAEVAHDADGEERQHKENTTKDIGFAHRRFDFGHYSAARRSERHQQDDEERDVHSR